MPAVILSFHSEEKKAENPFRDRQLSFRRALLHTLVTFITVLEVPLGFVQFLALLPQAIYSAVTGVITDVAYSSPVFLPLSSMAPLLPTGPNVITFFKRELTEAEMSAHNAKKVSLTGFRKMHPYVFRHVTPVTLGFIEEEDGQLDMKSYLGAVSASAAAYHFTASRWARGFLHAYCGLGESEGELGILTVGKSRWMKRVTEFVTEAGEKSTVEEECDEDFAVPEGGTVIETTFIRDRLLFIPNQPPLYHTTTETSLPVGAAYGLFVQYIPGMYLPDPLLVYSILARYALPNLIKKTVNYLPKQKEMETAFSELSSMPEHGVFQHLYYCIDLAIRSHVSIHAVIEENEYLGVILTAPSPFCMTVGGVFYGSESGDDLMETLITSTSHSHARREMAALLSTIELYDDDDQALPMNKKEITSSDLQTTGDLAYALFCRREMFTDEEQKGVKELFVHMSFPSPRYLPINSDLLSRFFSLCGKSAVWGRAAGITDFVLDVTTLFDFDPISFNIRAFGPTFLDLRKIGGTKYLIHGKKSHHYISAKKQVAGPPSKKKGSTLKEVYTHNRLVLGREAWREAKDKVEVSLREGYVMIMADDHAPTPAGGYVENDRESFTKVWDALVSGCRKYRVEKGYSMEDSGDEKPDADSAGKGKKEKPAKKRKLMLDEESDEEMRA